MDIQIDWIFTIFNKFSFFHIFNNSKNV